MFDLIKSTALLSRGDNAVFMSDFLVSMASQPILLTFGHMDGERHASDLDLCIDGCLSCQYNVSVHASV